MVVGTCFETEDHVHGCGGLEHLHLLLTTTQSCTVKKYNFHQEREKKKYTFKVSDVNGFGAPFAKKKK